MSEFTLLNNPVKLSSKLSLLSHLLMLFYSKFKLLKSHIRKGESKNLLSCQSSKNSAKNKIVQLKLDSKLLLLALESTTIHRGIFRKQISYFPPSSEELSPKILKSEVNLLLSKQMPVSTTGFQDVEYGMATLKQVWQSSLSKTQQLPTTFRSTTSVSPQIF